MGSFGSNDIRSSIEDELEWIFKDKFGHGIYEASADEKVQFLTAALEVLSYRFGSDQVD